VSTLRWTEVEGFGYKPVSLKPRGWSIDKKDISAEAEQVKWSFTGKLGRVAGFTLEMEDGTMLWREPFQTAIDIKNKGDILGFRPRVRYATRSE